VSPLPEWLPQVIPLEDFKGNVEKYLDHLYEIFLDDFVRNRANLLGVRVAIKKRPVEKGKEATFWHLLSSGKIEADRLPDLRRWERIAWPKSIIDHVLDSEVKAWQNLRKGEQRICLWLEAAEYLVVLADRGGYVILWTAYQVTREHQKRKLQKEYLAAKKLIPPPSH
jgi:hypothetical protein